MIRVKLTTTHAGAQDRLAFALTFRFSADTFFTTPLADGMAMTFDDDLSLSHTVRLPFFPFFLFLGVRCRLRNLAVQRYESGF